MLRPSVPMLSASSQGSDLVPGYFNRAGTWETEPSGPGGTPGLPVNPPRGPRPGEHAASSLPPRPCPLMERARSPREDYDVSHGASPPCAFCAPHYTSCFARASTQNPQKSLESGYSPEPPHFTGEEADSEKLNNFPQATQPELKSRLTKEPTHLTMLYYSQRTPKSPPPGSLPGPLPEGPHCPVLPPLKFTSLLGSNYVAWE